MEVIDANELKLTIGANVRRMRERRKWSQTALAELVGISRIAMNRIENGHALPDSDVLYAIADAFETTADALRQLSEKISAA